MNDDPRYYALQQIYGFVAERPGFRTKNNFELLLEFFTEINEDFDNGMKFDLSEKIIGKFGNVTVIDIKSAPMLINKDEFLKWLYLKMYQ
jgi:hypothetical protein